MLASKLKIPSPRTQLALLLILAGSVLVIASIVANFFPGAHGGHGPNDAGSLRLLQAISSVILFGIPPLIYAWMTFREQPLRELGFRPAAKNSFYPLTIALLIFAFPLEIWLGILNNHLPLAPWMSKMEADSDRQIALLLSGNGPMELIYNLLVIAIIPAVVEEVCFRGALQRVLIHLFKNPWAGIVVTGIWFSVSHFQFAGFFPRAFLGILLGAVCWYSDSLWPVIVAHAFYNGIQVVAATWYPRLIAENPSVPFYWALISLILVVIILAYMRKRSTVSYTQTYQ